MNLLQRFWKGKTTDPNYIPELDIGIGRRAPIENDYAFAVPFPAILPAHGITRVAVIAHIFYPDLCGELISSINHIPIKADLFISTDTAEKRGQIEKAFAGYDNGTIEIRVLPNRGRDIAPKIVGFADVYARYDYFLHIHTKKTLFDDKLSGWRTYLYQNLLGSPEIVNSILTLLQREEIGVVFPQHYELTRPAVHWGHCFRRSRDLLEQCGITLRQTMPLDFPSGSMFWGKSKAFRFLLDRKLELADFEEESGQTDGTMAHALEHSFLYFAEAAGYIWAKTATPSTYPHPETLLAVNSEEDITANLKKVYSPLLLETPDPKTPPQRLEVREVTDIDIRTELPLKNPAGRDVLLFVTYHPTGLKSRHVLRMIEAYHAAGMDVAVLSVVDSFETPLTTPASAAGHIVRANHGYDFSIWAHVLKLFPQLWDARTLFFANDSVFGPLDDGGFGRVMERLRASEADLVALTDSMESAHHFQSYFFAIKNRHETFAKMKIFWGKIRSIPHKKTVISQYEFPLRRFATENGVVCEALFPIAEFKGPKYEGNPTLLLWKKLIGKGFPFVKVQLIRDKAPGTNTHGLDSILQRKGYDQTIIDEHLKMLRPL